MTLPVSPSVQLHCHHCTRWLGESRAPLTFAGIFKIPQDRTLLPEPRDTYRCKSCGWINVFRPATATAPNWRDIELKQRRTG